MIPRAELVSLEAGCSRRLRSPGGQSLYLGLVLSLTLLISEPTAVLAGVIHIGKQKQLLWDEHLIEGLSNTRFVLNRAEKAPNNPVIRQDRPWEGNLIRVATVFYDEDEGQFRLWYTSENVKPSPDDRWERSETIVCYATSSDGYHWEKRSLGLVEFNGSTENNILDKESWPGFKGGIIRDGHEVDPSKRYKGMVMSVEGSDPTSTSSPGMRFDLYYSPDGFEWGPYEGNPVIDWGEREGRWGPTALMGWDPLRRVYATHMEVCRHRKCPQRKRLIGRAESPDMTRWTGSVPIIVPDREDASDTEFYNFWATPYQGVIVGMIWTFRTTNTVMYPQFTFSRDGIRYDRRFREPLILLGPAGDFDSVLITALQPIIHEDKIFIYYKGRNWRAPEQLDQLGEERARGAIGLAVLPLDGFVSLDGAATAQDYSEVVTGPFVFSGSKLHLNMQAGIPSQGNVSEVRVEILTPDYFPVAGYSFEDADTLSATGTARVASWRGGDPDVSQLAGKPIKLKFYFKHTKLFSFQFQ